MTSIAKFLPTIVLMAALPAWPAEAVRQRQNFDAGWRFHRGDTSGAHQAAFDDRAWTALDVPHDWSIDGPYAASNASGTGFLPAGIGWYRKSFTIDEARRGQKLSLAFDGVYRDSDVWINGHLLGHRPYGYSSFAYDITPYVNFGAKANLVAVRVDHHEIADSRWYTGSGIYRHVWLESTQPVHVAHWGTYVHTPAIDDQAALVTIETSAVNGSAATAAVRLVTAIEDPAGKEVASASAEKSIAAGATAAFVQQTPVAHPTRWTLAAPAMYTAVTRVYVGSALTDEYRTPFGIRSIRFDANHGFFLNGKSEKLKGVCIHHDLGGLGAAFSESALERRLKALKALGVNAIRCSHNPMAPELYELCDRLGLLVMDEAFDEWIEGKHKWVQGWNAGKPSTDGYHEVFDAWSTRDIQDMVLRDRNHPSIVLWSIGNEIDYPGDPFGHPRGHAGLKPGMSDADLLPPVARRLIAAIKALDGTRPVTEALADTLASNATGLADLLDVAGYNYLEQHYAADHATYPERIVLGSENSHTLAAWAAVAQNEFVAGQFLWTGIDYLGESHQYPWRGSTAGLLDFCGFAKPAARLREALWGDRPMVYAAAGTGNRMTPLVEHWNWAQDTRTAIPVEVYTNCGAAELFLNGKSLGGKTVANPLEPVLKWDVPNQAGSVLVIGKRDGKEAARFELATVGAADHFELSSSGTDIASIEIQVVDAAGRRVATATPALEVSVSGAGRFVALDTADARDTTPVHTPRRNAFEGRALALVRPAAGETVVRVSAAGLKPAEIRLR